MKWSIISKKERDRLEAIETRVNQVYRWCAEFEQMSDATEYIKGIAYVVDKEGVKIEKPEFIDEFRDRMRKKYGNRVS